MAHVRMTHPELGDFDAPERYVRRAEQKGFTRVEDSPAKPPRVPRKAAPAAKKAAAKKTTAKKTAAKKTTTPTAGNNNA